jgi:Protein of unknown function (DUF1501)
MRRATAGNSSLKRSHYTHQRCYKISGSRRTIDGMSAGDLEGRRDHNPAAMTMWFAGGGVKAGHIVGATDEIGQMLRLVNHRVARFLWVPEQFQKAPDS